MLKGEKFGRLTFLNKLKAKGPSSIGLFVCDCGEYVETYISNVKRGKKLSCGCLRKEYLLNPINKKHGFSKTDTYSSWVNMLYRCNNSNATGYENYGGRGIKVCDEWMSFENFYKDMGDRPQGMSIDRIDTNKNYELSNCRWATRSEQARNCRKDRVSSSIYKGVSFYKRTKKWEAYININGSRKRIGYFDSEEEAFLAYKEAHLKNKLIVPMYTLREDSHEVNP